MNRNRPPGRKAKPACGRHIVHSIVNRVPGGRIVLSSQPGEGTTFNRELPPIAPEQTRDNAWSAVAPSPAKS